MTATSYAMSDVMSAWDLNESSGGYDARRGIFEMPHCSRRSLRASLRACLRACLRASLRANQKTATTAQCHGPVKGRSPGKLPGAPTPCIAIRPSSFPQ